jgi:hypothetical protein
MPKHKLHTPESVGNQHGLVCPKCGRGDRLSIAAVQWHDLLPDGTDNHGDVEWDDDSVAMCSTPDCVWHGTVGQLKQLEMED